MAAAVACARRVPGLIDRIRTIYADVQQAIEARKPRCDISGKCCQFEKFRHLLFVTTAELAAFGMERDADARGKGAGDRGQGIKDEKAATGVALAFAPAPLSPVPFPLSPGTSDGCPYQIAGRCSVHTIRPFGCRIYFCDPTAQDWQQDQYELFHLRLKQLHDELSIPYLYVEWRQGLKALQDDLP